LSASNTATLVKVNPATNFLREVGYKREFKNNAENVSKCKVKKEHKAFSLAFMFLPFFLFEVFFFVPVFIFVIFVLVSHFCSPP
jgi:prolipoprotein diacylglyceryltransferase